MLDVVLRSDTDVLLVGVPPAPYGPPEKAHGNGVSDIAVAGRRRSGAGTITVLPWSVGRSFEALGLGVVRDLIANSVEELRRDVILRLELQPQVEVTL